MLRRCSATPPCRTPISGHASAAGQYLPKPLQTHHPDRTDKGFTERLGYEVTGDPRPRVRVCSSIQSRNAMTSWEQVRSESRR